VRDAVVSIDLNAMNAHLDPAGIEATLRRLIGIRSVTGEEHAVQTEMLRVLVEAGVPAERLDPDPAEIARDPDWPGEEAPRTALPIVVGRLGRSGGRRILLVGHVDVVPPGDPARWTVDPWAGEVRDGNLYGRGACDMKGGVVAIVEALRLILASADPETFDGQLVAAFVPSEEDGGQGMLAAIRAGVTGDAAVITEPTSLDVVTAHAGAITFRLTVPGRAAHASMRREGVSAIEKLCVLMDALREDETRRNAAETDPLMTAIDLPYATNIGVVSGGDWASTVPDRVVADGRYGVRLGQTVREAEAELRECIARASAADDFLRDHQVRLDVVGGRFASAQVPPDHPLPAALADAAEAVLGRRPTFGARPYGADMRLLVNEGGTPTVIFGPGDVRVAHSADENVPLGEVGDCARVLAVWALRELGASGLRPRV
jgi:acetylornithine deacetylase